MNSSAMNLLAADPSTVNTLGSFLPLILIGFIFYFLLILPAQRRQKKTREMMAGLKTGDRVITTSGILGTIVSLEDNVVILRVADQVKMRFLKNSVVGLQAPESAEKK